MMKTFQAGAHSSFSWLEMVVAMKVQCTVEADLLNEPIMFPRRVMLSKVQLPAPTQSRECPQISRVERKSRTVQFSPILLNDYKWGQESLNQQALSLGLNRKPIILYGYPPHSLSFRVHLFLVGNKGVLNKVYSRIYCLLRASVKTLFILFKVISRVSFKDLSVKNCLIFKSIYQVGFSFSDNTKLYMAKKENEENIDYFVRINVENGVHPVLLNDGIKNIGKNIIQEFLECFQIQVHFDSIIMNGQKRQERKSVIFRQIQGIYLQPYWALKHMVPVLISLRLSTFFYLAQYHPKIRKDCLLNVQNKPNQLRSAQASRRAYLGAPLIKRGEKVQQGRRRPSMHELTNTKENFPVQSFSVTMHKICKLNRTHSSGFTSNASAIFNKSIESEEETIPERRASTSTSEQSGRRVYNWEYAIHGGKGNNDGRKLDGGSACKVRLNWGKTTIQSNTMSIEVQWRSKGLWIDVWDSFNL